MYQDHTPSTGSGQRIAVVVPAYNEETYNLGFGDVRFGDFTNLPISNLQILNPRDRMAETVRRMSERLLRPGLTGLVQAHKDEVSAMGGSRVLDEAYIEACQTLGPARLLLFDLRVIGDTFKILAKGQGL
jgi:hypothetical protein